MKKTADMERLQAQRGGDIGGIVRATLEKYRGRNNLVSRVALDLGVTDSTAYNWFPRLGIDLDEYRTAAGPVGAEAGEPGSEGTSPQEVTP